MADLFYYALQVQARGEEVFINRFNHWHRDNKIDFYYPKRSLIERKCGQKRKRLAAVFPSYVFASFASCEDAVCSLPALRKIKGFYKFLPSNKTPRALSGNDLEIVLHFIKHDRAKVSRVTFNDEDKIVVLEGPLKGLEGSIIKVDKRKGRAKIKLDLYENSFLVDLSFEIVDRIKNRQKTSANIAIKNNE